MLKKENTGFAVFSPFKSGRTKNLTVIWLVSLSFYYPFKSGRTKKQAGTTLLNFMFYYPFKSGRTKNFIKI